MTIDPEMLMAYADGELDPLNAKRVERAMAADPAVAAEVAQHQALRARLAGHFAPVAEEPLPARLTDLLASNVVALPQPKPRPVFSRWREAAAMAACLTIGVSLGLGWDRGPVTTHGGQLYASGSLAHALDTQLASVDGAVKVPISFRNRAGQYCRVFNSAATDGIACHESAGWALRQTRAGYQAATTDYRQAGSTDVELMIAAQTMMAGDPLDAVAETKARNTGWQSSKP